MSVELAPFGAPKIAESMSTADTWSAESISPAYGGAFTRSATAIAPVSAQGRERGCFSPLAAAAHRRVSEPLALDRNRISSPGRSSAA